MNCEWNINDAGHHVCRLCGYVYASTPVGPLYRNCPTKAPPRASQGPQMGFGLGDHVGLALDAVGVTEKRVAWFLRAARIVAKDGNCNCEERKARLNRIGERLLGWARRKGVLK